MARKRPGETLTDKQRTFCNEYVIDLNATQAAVKAGYSEDSARSTASHLLDDPDVAAYVRQLQENKFLVLRITAQDVLAELVKIGFAELEDEILEPRTKNHGSASPDSYRDTMTNGKEEAERILASLSYKQETQEETRLEKQEPRTKSHGSTAPDSYRDTMTEEHSMVKRAAMSYKRVVVDERTGTKTTYTFTLRDKIMALRIIAQHLGLFVPDKKKERMELTLIRPRGKFFENDNATKNDSREKRDGTNVTM